MVRFFNKNELIVIMLVILLFDLNGFCDISASHITYEDKRAYFGLLLAMSFLLFDIYIYRSLVNANSIPDISYTNNRKHHLDCEGDVEDQIEDHSRQLNEIKKICTSDKNNDGHLIAERIVMLFINIIVVIIVMTCIFFGGNHEKSNNMTTRVLLSIPLVLLSCSISGCAIFL